VPKLYNPDPECTSASFGGQVFLRGEDGSFEVPADALEALASHGFSTSKAEPKAITPEVDHAALASELGEALGVAKVSLLEQAGVVDALKAERDALADKVKALEAAAPKGKR